jgi:hypothetical protein
MAGYPSEKLTPLAGQVLALRADNGKLPQAFRHLSETLDRLQFRLDDLLKAEADLVAHAWGHPVPFAGKRTGHESQIRLLNALEAYHQQSYAVVSAAIKVCRLALPTRLAAGAPVNSASKWLKWVRETIPGVECFELERSLEVRSKHIDHPQNSRYDDWLSIASNWRANIVFFRRAASEAVFRPRRGKDVFNSDFPLPVCTDGELFPPDPKLVSDDIWQLVSAVVDSVLKAQQEDGARTIH